MDLGFFSWLVSVPADPRIHRPTEGRREASSGGQISHELFGPPVDHVHGRFGRLCRALPALAMILSAGLVVIILSLMQVLLIQPGSRASTMRRIMTRSSTCSRTRRL